MDIDYKHIGRRIREERLKAGLTQAELAEKAKSSTQYISIIENAKKSASLNIVIHIANALGVSIDRLVADNLSEDNPLFDAELAEVISGCTDYERHIILDIAIAAKCSLKKYREKPDTKKS